jgi:hypothetical protein
MTLGGDRQFMQNQIAQFQALLDSQDLDTIEKARTEIDTMLDAFENSYVR